MRRIFILISLGAVLWGVGASAEIPIPGFYEVQDGIYRGARPGRAGLEALAQLNVRTDLDLENDREAIAQESRDAQAVGVRLISMPMSGFWAPHDREMRQILAVLSDPANSPVFVHCKHGEDRTGLVIGLYRVFYDHWTPARAYQEMRRLRFHPELIFLSHYFEEATEGED